MPERALEELLDQAIDAGTGGPELQPMLRIAAALREMPAEDFKSRLKTELQRRAIMAIATAPVREGFRTVTPYITVPEGDRLIEFLKRAFDAEETFRSPAPAGFHVELRIGDSMVMIGSGEAARGRENIGAFHLFVPDCDATYLRAIGAGATSEGEPADRPYGERSGFVKDFAGNYWYIGTRFPSNPAPEGLGNLVPYLHPMGGALKFIDFLKRAFGAEELAVIEHAGRVMNASVRIGDTILEMGEREQPQSARTRLFLYVDDCDAWYRRAVAAGATSIEPPTDRPYGRTATLHDAFGHEWTPTSLPVTS